MMLQHAATSAVHSNAVGPIVSQILGWTSTIYIELSPAEVASTIQSACDIAFELADGEMYAATHRVDGLSLDFVYLNVQGFLAYSIYNVALFSWEVVRDQYRDRHDGHSPSVRGNDVAFAVHAFAISCITLYQTTIYKRAQNQQVSAYASYFIAMSSIALAVCTIVGAFGGITWLDLLYYLSYLKLVISFIKFLPQAWLNFKRKSTVGWSIHNILLDLTGGMCSFAQLLLDAHLENDWSSLRGNPAKLILSLLAMAFDTLFIIQHYVLYRNSSDTVCGAGHAGIPENDSENLIDDERTPLVA